MKRVNGKKEATNTMVLTITGSTPPSHVFFGYIRVPTRTFYPSPLMCNKCGNFGHNKLRCEQNETCLVCGETAVHPNCSKDPKCPNCEGPHPAFSRNCPKQQEEQAIVRIRVDLGISQGAAVKEYRTRCAATKNCTTVQQRLEATRTDTHQDNKDKRIRELENQVALLFDQLKTLQNCANSVAETEESADSDDTMVSESSSTSSTPKRNRNRGSSEERSTKSELELKNEATPSPILADWSKSTEFSW
ncbi:uncharacterized protein LOC129738042 [Uranotaenia lowii]|uniref:uncharacterized protein LOC129738042 n=1 Tax=Uranotaenia lowii TaxID=190385 RepID=UPI002479376F|nr:uncharacterized protein LOC129738042 [Uranotaenia lowii]